VELDHSRFRDTFADRYQTLPGINQVSPVYHGSGFDKTNPSADSFTVIGVDGNTFWDVALSRDDFAGKPLKELVKALGDSTPRCGLELPRSAKTLSVTIKALTPEPDIYLSAVEGIEGTLLFSGSPSCRPNFRLILPYFGMSERRRYS
jgi:hypothetical protein